MHRPSSLFLPLVFALLVLLAGCQSPMRPYRFDVPTSPYAATQAVAHKMSGTLETRPAYVDPTRGVALSQWKITGAAAAIRLWPPGRDSFWILQRYRASVRPFGAVSMVLFDIERLRCNRQGFQWDAVRVWGRCTAMTDVSRDEQRALDARGATLAASPP